MRWIKRRVKRLIRRRSSRRGVAFGWLLEDVVEDRLREMQERGLIVGFVRHEHHSEEDQGGRDFTVEKRLHNIVVSVSFGVTVSAGRCVCSRELHRPVPQLWFSNVAANGEIRDRILALFNSQSV